MTRTDPRGLALAPTPTWDVPLSDTCTTHSFKCCSRVTLSMTPALIAAFKAAVSPPGPGPCLRAPLHGLRSGVHLCKRLFEPRLMTYAREEPDLKCFLRGFIFKSLVH